MSQELFSDLEIDTIGEIMNISMGSAATVASTLLDNKVTITTPKVRVMTVEEFDITEFTPAIAVDIKYIEGISGHNILILRKEDVGVILSQMMCTEIPKDFEIDMMAESAICELMNQMMGSSATVLSKFLGCTINISTPNTVPVTELTDFKNEHFGKNQNIVLTEFVLSITGKMESNFVSVMPIELAKEIIQASLNFEDKKASDMQNLTNSNVEDKSTVAPEIEQNTNLPDYNLAPPPRIEAQIPAAATAEQEAAPQVSVQNYSYNNFGEASSPVQVPSNLELIMSVPVSVSVELGRTKRKIKDILEFGQGTIVELDKQAGSHVDVMVNGQLIAHGDVVVVDDNFSIRITEILKTRDELKYI